jgi:hypothetical protein
MESNKEEIENNLKSRQFKKSNLINNLLVSSKFRSILMLVLMAILISTVPTVIPFLHRSNAQEPATSLESGGGVGQQLTIENIEKYIAVVSGIAEIGVVILLYKTVKDFAELAKVSKLQTEVRFRPWIGPSSGILRMAEKSDTDQYRYAISLKNFGEVPSSAVTALSAIFSSLPTREIFKKKPVSEFNLGPLLPNMEKKYWIFIDTDKINKSVNGVSQVFVALYFSYTYVGGTSAYGTISQYDGKNDTFIHRDMWLD